MNTRVMATLTRRSALAALLAVPAVVRAATPVEAFDASAAREPWRLPLKGVDDITGSRDCAALTLSGRWPEALRGRFYRNGPAWYERGGKRYRHWFDGDGMVQQFSITGPAGAPVVAHRGRLVGTAKLRAEQAAGRFLVSAFGTAIPHDGRTPLQGPDSFNTANTNAIEHAGLVLALWEGGSAHALDPADLQTRGPVTWGEGLAQMPFSAHPKVDPQGQLWNIGTAGQRLVVWHIDAQGRLVSARVGELPLAHAMVHDMAVTANHIVVPIPPVTLHFDRLLNGGEPADALRFHAGQPLRVLVMHKADITQRRVFELPPQMVFHVGNAFEAADGAIELSFIGSPGHHFLSQTAVALMNGGAITHPEPSRTQRVRLHLATGRTELQAFDDDAEFPRMDPRRVGSAARWLLTAAAWRPGHDTGFMHGIQLRDLVSGRNTRFDYGEGRVAEEHILVPKPGRAGELDAWVLGTHFDSHRRVTMLSVFEAAALADGPIAQAALPYALPYGFHGNFTAGA